MTQPTPGKRANAETLLALGFGAGLSGREIINLTVDDIHADEEGVVVRIRGDRPRSVPVLREWERALFDQATVEPGEAWAFRQQHTGGNPNLITDFVSRGAGKIHLEARRLHATWIVHHLEAGTPLLPLLRAAGLASPEALERFFPFVRKDLRNDDRTLLRDATARPRR